MAARLQQFSIHQPFLLMRRCRAAQAFAQPGERSMQHKPLQMSPGGKPWAQLLALLFC